MFNESVKLKWLDKEYECLITMTTVKKASKSGINILETAAYIDNDGIPDPAHVAVLYAFLLNQAGCNVTEEEIYTSFMSDLSSTNDSERGMKLIAACRFAIRAFFPPINSPERVSKDKKEKK